MPTPQLKVRRISAASKPPVACSHLNSAGHCQLPQSTSAIRPAGKALGRFSVNPPPVMCAMPLGLRAGGKAKRACL